MTEDEPPGAAPNADLKSIGKPTPRVDGKLKVTGAAKYTADINLPGMLYAAMLTSIHPSAKIKSIDTSEAEKYPGVKAVHILERVYGQAQMKGEEKEKYPRVRFAGQPLGAIAATSLEAADEAARLVKVDYDPQPFVIDVEKAQQPGSPIVFEGQAVQAGTAGGGGGPSNVKQQGNVRGPNRQGTRGVDIDKALKDADVVVEAEYRTQVQTHSALETHGVVADFKPDMLTVWASTQGTGSVRDELSAVFQLGKSKIRVITDFMGGGFGAKFGAGNFGVLATHLSKKAGAPVKLMLSRKDEHLSVGNRPNSIQKVRIGAKKDGTLTAIHLVSYGTAGVGTGAGAGGPARGLYKCPAILTEEYDVFTHAGPGASFRAPGHPQGVLIRAGDRRARPQARHRPACPSRQNRRRSGSQQRPSRRTSHQAPKKSAGQTESARLRFRPGEDRYRHGSVDLVSLHEPQIPTARSASPATVRSSCTRRCRTSAAESKPRLRANRGRGTGPSAAGHHHQGRRHELPRRPRIRRQRHHRLHHPARPRGGL